MGQPPATAAAAAVATMAAAVTTSRCTPSCGSGARGVAGGGISPSGTTRWGGICICTPHAHCTHIPHACADVQVQPDGARRRCIDVARRAAPRESPALQRFPRRVRIVQIRVSQLPPPSSIRSIRLLGATLWVRGESSGTEESRGCKAQSRPVHHRLPLGVPALFLEECYHLGHCPEDDLWPCNFPNASLAPSLPRLVSNWGALCGFHQMLI